MQRAKEGNRKGNWEVYRESKRKRGKKGTRWRDWEKERSRQFGEGSIKGPSNWERVGLTLKFDELL